MALAHTRWVSRAILATLLFTPAIRAALLNTAEVTLTPTDAGGTGPFSLLQDLAGGLTISHATTGGLGSSASATAHVQPGIIQLAGAAHGSIDTVARGVYRDMFTINAPGVPAGTNGSFTLSVGIDGALSATTGIARAKWVLNAEIGGGPLTLLATGNQRSPNAPPIPTDAFDPFSTYFRTVPFQFGVPTELAVELIGTATARYDDTNAPGAAAFTFGQEFFWQGIFAVTPVGGTALDDVSLTSDSGTNWLEAISLPEPVPEPATLILLLPLVAVTLRRRHRQ